MSLKPQIKARVRFVSPDEGGRKTPPCSGTRSDLKVIDQFTSCVIRGETADQIFAFGIEYNVTLELLFWDHYRDAVHAGMQVQLNEGSRMVGVGRIEAILNQ